MKVRISQADILEFQGLKKNKRRSRVRALFHVGVRGQVWTTFAEGVVMLAIAGILFSVMNQVYTQNLAPLVLRLGVNADNASFIQTAWSAVLLAVLVAFIVGMIDVARRRPSEYGYI